MSRIDKKIATCERWLEAMSPFRKDPNTVRFTDAFEAFVHAFGAVRQYILDDLKPALHSNVATPEQQWLENLEYDVDVATIIGLRDSEYHIDVTETTKQVVHVLPPTVLVLRSGLITQLIRPDGTAEPEVVVDEPNHDARAEATSLPDVIWVHRIDPALLPPSFMLARIKLKGRVAGLKRRQKMGHADLQKADVLQNLQRWDLAAVAERALRVLRDAVDAGRVLGLLH